MILLRNRIGHEDSEANRRSFCNRFIPAAQNAMGAFLSERRRLRASLVITGSVWMGAVVSPDDGKPSVCSSFRVMAASIRPPQTAHQANQTVNMKQISKLTTLGNIVFTYTYQALLR